MQKVLVSGSAGFIGGYTDTSAGYQNIRRNKFSPEDEDDESAAVTALQSHIDLGPGPVNGILLGHQFVARAHQASAHHQHQQNYYDEYA